MNAGFDILCTSKGKCEHCDNLYSSKMCMILKLSTKDRVLMMGD